MRKIACEDFEDKVINSPIPLVVLFTSEWCGSAYIVKGILEALERTYTGQFECIDVIEEECEEIVKKFGITRIPVIQIFSGGEIIDIISGVPSRNSLEQSLKKIIIT